MGKRKMRPHTAAATLNLEKCPVELLSRPATRNVVTREWLDRMRNKGVIISEAELKYRHWLGISEGGRTRTPSGYRPKTASPYREGEVRHTRASTLRIEHLREPLDQVNYSDIARNFRQFDKRCRRHVATPILTERVPASETYSEFISGARYNGTHHVDSRSLERLGVYIPRKNLAGTFINPAGIIPHSKHRAKARVTCPEQSLQKLTQQVDTVQVPSVFDIRDGDITKHALSSSSLGSALAGSNSSCADSNELKTDSHNELLQEVLATPSALSNAKDDSPMKAESKLVSSTNSLTKLIRAPSNTPNHMNAMKQAEEDLSQDDQKLSAEAQQLAQDIVQQSLHLSDSHSSSGDDDSLDNGITAIVHEETEGQLQQQNMVHLVGEQENETGTTLHKQDIISKTQSEASMCNRSSSAIVVDMTQLNIN